MRNLVADYWRAISVGAGGAPGRYPFAMRSVMWARSKYGIGPRLYSLFRLMKVPPAQWSDFLVDERLRAVLRKINPEEHREVVNDKLAFHEHCVTHGLADIPVVCVLQGRPEDARLSSWAILDYREWADTLDAYDGERLFFKLINGTWGLDAFLATRDGELWSFDGRQGSELDLYDFAMKRLARRKGWLVQPAVSPHRMLSESIAPNALCTIRAITTRNICGGPKLLFAAMRMPVGKNVTDNFAHGASGNAIGAIDLKSGQIVSCYRSSSSVWPIIEHVDNHPDTNKRVRGLNIPFWSETKELILAGQESLPQLRTIGWDVAVTDAGPLIVEANATYDVDLIQVAHQRGIAFDLMSSINKMHETI